MCTLQHYYQCYKDKVVSLTRNMQAGLRTNKDHKRNSSAELMSTSFSDELNNCACFGETLSARDVQKDTALSLTWTRECCALTIVQHSVPFCRTSLQVFRSSGLQVIGSTGHEVYRSSGLQVCKSLGLRVIGSTGLQVIGSTGH